MQISTGYPFLVILALFIGLSGCASKPERASCDQRDWFEIGRTDGARGTTNDQLNRHRDDCGPKGRSDWDTMYANGRNAGLVEYCSPENAVQLGKSGIAYMFVCPPTTEAEFLAGYRKGQRLRELELETRQLESRIESLNEKLTTVEDDSEKKRVGEELAKLQARHQENQEELGRTFSKSQ
jgi:hypothetical protein